jgi:hypothetical protein
MTYCVAMHLADGLVFISDSRTNAGIDQISTFRKLFIFSTRKATSFRQQRTRLSCNWVKASTAARYSIAI